LPLLEASPGNSSSSTFAASSAIVKGFFNTFYVPNNATLAIVGDYDPAHIKEQVGVWRAAPKAAGVEAQ